jgi:hypothetical protein
VCRLAPSVRGTRGGKVGQVERRNGDVNGALVSLIYEIGQAARSGWPQTLRLITLLVVAAGAVAVLLAIGR